ncbi:cupin domain-containing protein [Cyanobium sp. T1G-Tous]|uniref:cupin domain-containing protein n=1 Tax=Cyanobium sp. T1G-Tous TaxID=2823722 RepID=UPI0020CBB203|nr:cupin domain-containing protein [Cyanobium sp. T1G-Tous]
MGNARADDGHSAAALGVKVETLIRSDRSWNGDLLPKLNDIQAEVTVLRITVPAGVTLPRHLHPVINAGVLLQGNLRVESDDGASKSLQAGQALIEMVNKVHRGVSLGPEPAVIVVVYVAPKGSPITVPAASAPNGKPHKAADEIVTVRPLTSSSSKQKLKQFVGISGANSGARGLSMNRVVIPPGGQADAHRHVGSESAIFLLEGRVKTFYGPCLERSVVNQTGDFIFIPAGVDHMPVNLSANEEAIAIVARNDANEQEHVELHAPPGKAGSAPGVPTCAAPGHK